MVVGSFGRLADAITWFVTFPPATPVKEPASPPTAPRTALCIGVPFFAVAAATFAQAVHPIKPPAMGIETGKPNARISGLPSRFSMVPLTIPKPSKPLS